MGLIALGVVGTGVVLGVTGGKNAAVGMVWTFVLMGILSAVFYLNLHSHLGLARVGGLLGLRILALALLLPMLFQPVIRYVARPAPEKPLVFLIDTSGSMSFPDVQNGPTRLQSVWQTIRPELGRINEHFIPQFYTFATEVQKLGNPDELARLQADGKATDLVGGIGKALGKVRRADAELVLISDGIDNTSPNVVDGVRGSSWPIHAVAVGSSLAEPASMANIAVDNVEAEDDFIVNHESKIKATIKSTGLPNRLVDVKMAELDGEGKVIGETRSEKLVLEPLPEGQAVQLPYKPKAVGVHRLAVWVDPVAGERSTVDNRQEFQGLALDPRMKVLYIEGRARPEYKDLNRALSSDSNIEASTLLRIQQDRFAAAGTVDGEPLTRMPNSLEEWKKFDVIILGDLDSSFLTKIQQTAIEQVVEQGAGLLMIGGQNSFGPGGYKDSPIEKALPVFVGELNASQEKSPFVPQLTPEGVVHPAMEGLGAWFGGEGSGEKPEARNPNPESNPKPETRNPKPGTRPGKELPPVRGNVVVPKAKSGAQVLLVHADRPGPDGKPQVVLAVEHYGQGRSAAFTVDTTYLWSLPMAGMGQDSPYKTFWGQIVRWLAGEDVRNRQRGAGIEGLLNKSIYQLGESVRVRALVRDEKGDATRYAQVSVTLKKPDGKEEKVPLSPSSARTGMYEATIANPEKGEYAMELIASKEGKELGKQALKFTVIPPAEEMLKLAANPKLLEEIANQSGPATHRGMYYSLQQFPTLIDQLIRQDKGGATAKQETVPLGNTMRSLMALTGTIPRWDKKYDLPMQGMLVIALLTAEWLLRRRWQLP